MLSEGRVGPVLAADGSPERLRLDNHGALVATDLHGRYYEATRRGNVFMASMQAAAALGTALTSTAVTFTLYNPTNSGVYIEVIDCVLTITTPPAGASAYVYAANVNPVAAAPSTNTDLVVRNALLGGVAGKGKAYSATTLPATPVAIRAHSSIVATGAATPFAVVDKLDGAIILAENTAITLQGLTTASSGIISMTWAEWAKV